MKNCGKTIVELRKKNGMTQSELGDALNVTYQAVSKWENDLSQPSVDMLAEICKLFKITVDDFMKMADGDYDSEPVEETTAATASGAETASIVRDELLRIKEEERQEKALAEQKAQEERQRSIEAAEREEHIIEARWFRFGFIMSLIVAIGVGVWMGITEGLVYGLLGAYLLFAFGTHIGHECVVHDFFIGAWEKTVHMPGIIFSLDISSIVFMLLYKFIIAPLVAFILGIVIGLLGTFVAMIMAMFTFPFNIVRFIKEMI